MNRGFWLLWVSGCALASCLGLGFVFALVVGLRIPDNDVAVAVAFLLLGSVIGTAQSLVVGRYLKGRWHWILATGLGSALGVVIVIIARVINPAWVLVGLVSIGTCVGVLQSLTLKPFVRKAWIIANVISWAVGIFVEASAVLLLAGGHSIRTVAQAIVTLSIYAGIAGAIGGAITGYTFVLIVQQTVDEQIA